MAIETLGELTRAAATAAHKLDRHSMQIPRRGTFGPSEEFMAWQNKYDELKAAVDAARYEVETELLNRTDVAYPEDIARIKAERAAVAL